MFVEEPDVEKAYTAAAFGANPSDLVERAAGSGPSVRDLPNTLFIPGGVVIESGDAAIAGVGVGGTPSGEKDRACAAAGAASLGGSNSK